MWLSLKMLRRRLAAEGGFTMPAVLGAMMLVMVLSAAAIAAAGGDIGLARNDQDDKQAYAAAEAGVADYLGNLNADSNYWAKCTNVPSPVSQRGATGSARRWKDVPNASSQYSIELLPPTSGGTCLEDDPLQSMVKDGNIKIRSTGRVKGTNNYRTVTATFRRAGFLDFLYYTDLENQSPQYIKRTAWANRVTRSTDTNGVPTNEGTATEGQPTLKQWAADYCERPWWGGEGRQSSSWRGQYQDQYGNWTPNSWWSRSTTVDTGDICGEIQFADSDEVNGPFHSNDSIMVCGSPTFGTLNGNDRVEISADDWRSNCGGSNPVFRPTLIKNAATLSAPKTNESLKELTLSGYSFVGQTDIVLEGANMKVTNPNVAGGAQQTMPLPSNGVVYVANGTSPACGDGYDPTDSQARPAGCGDVRLSGSYTKDLTIAAQNDIVVMNDVTRPALNKSLLGLISGGFVRIWHPVDSSCQGQTPTNIRVDAAILALSGSFTVDNYWCGGELGTLTVNGAIAQLHRGVVGQSGGGGRNGYIKNYNYDKDLKFRSPPHFLDPLQASWRILRQGEQSPPQRG